MAGYQQLHARPSATLPALQRERANISSGAGQKIITMILIKDNEMIKLILTLTPQWMGTAATQRALEGRLLLVNLLCKVVSIMIMIFDDHDDHDGYDAGGAGDAVLQGNDDDQDHGDDDGVDDQNLTANQSDTRILVGQTPTSFHPVLPSEQLGRQVGRRFFKPVCCFSFPYNPVENSFNLFLLISTFPPL